MKRPKTCQLVDWVEQGRGHLDDIVLTEFPDLGPKLIIGQCNDNTSVDHTATISPNNVFIVEYQSKHPASLASHQERLASLKPWKRPKIA
jgi:hypothetical protein